MIIKQELYIIRRIVCKTTTCFTTGIPNQQGELKRTNGNCVCCTMGCSFRTFLTKCDTTFKYILLDSVDHPNYLLREVRNYVPFLFLGQKTWRQVRQMVITEHQSLFFHIHSLVFSLRGRAGRNQSPVM